MWLRSSETSYIRVVHRVFDAFFCVLYTYWWHFAQGCQRHMPLGAVLEELTGSTR